jgi:cell division transport system permease protein
MRLQFVLGEVFRGLRRNLSMVLSVILVTFVSLAFVGASVLIQLQVNKLKDDWYDLVEVAVFLCPDGSTVSTCAAGAATPAQQAEIQRVIDTELADVVAQTFVETKEDAFARFVENYPGGVFEGTQMTPDDMQASLRLKLVDPSQYQVVADVLAGRDGVEEVSDERAVFEPLFDALDKATQLAAGLAVVMLVTAALLITTTIRLSAVSRREETEIMRYVGASNLFVQLPFILEGAIAALIGSVLAVVGLWAGVRYLIAGWLEQQVNWVAYIGAVDVLTVAPFLVAVAVILAVVSSGITLFRYARA